ncbi:outer membrane beta-barrel protein [Flavobacterium selenitireducens]|uniref:outer membrane beta-barrel protein n=1 Tax=Flavobacterium selenitireducens TaxID=2722704 RepID=UPI00168A990D|nr:outer membrane beta-barrel protein [Flavobacterium selenitireducens]MBD3580910.1 PorT family protein [Flavobacterium selenitireducens]
MKKLLAMALLLPLAAIAQIKFENGYIIANDGKRTDCLIRNRGWNNNPTKFEYKLSAEASVIDGDLQNIAEFGIEGDVKYTRATVDMERSSVKVGKQQRDAKYKLVSETHFLRNLYTGQHSLYVLEESGLLKFFDRKPSGEFSQLIYIEYIDQNRVLRKYNHFHSQLLNEFSCPDATLSSFGKLEYKISSLTDYYRKTGECKGEKAVVQKRAKGDFNLRPFVGIKNMKLNADPGGQGNAEVSSKKSSVAYGLEFEYILPTNKNKWAVLVALEYNTLKDKLDLPDGISTIDKRAEIEYSAIQIPVGARYYTHLSDNMKFFATGLVVLNFMNKDSQVVYNGGADRFDYIYFEGNSYNFGIGAGLSYKKLNAEIRYYAPQRLFQTADGKFNKLSLTVSYAIF